jgi:carbon-monoxide dehydrogenase medium subunit
MAPSKTDMGNLDSNLSYLPTLPKFDYLTPKSIEEACSLLAEYKDKAKVIAGGTDLLVSMRSGKIAPQYLIDIKSIPDMDKIHYSEKDGLRIGALATLHSIASSPLLRHGFELLSTACHKIGSPQTRNMGTIGGNICNGGPSQDSIPSLLVLEAKLKLVSLQGEREVPVQDFYIAPFQTALNQAELLTEVQIPTPPPHSAGSYQWLTKMTAVDETLVGVAILMTRDPSSGLCQDVRIGLCSVSPTPIRAREAEKLLRGERVGSELIEQVARVAAGETRPRSRAGYRRQMTAVLVKRTINEVWQKI